MRVLHPSFIEVLEALINSDVDFLVIGGYAVNFHGYGRPTGDLDLWLRPDNENKARSLSAFRALDYPDKNIENISRLNFEKAQAFYVGEAPLRIDFLTKVNIVSFKEAWREKEILTVEALKIPFIDYKHLVLTKISTGRTKDNLDLEELQKVRRHKNRE